MKGFLGVLSIGEMFDGRAWMDGCTGPSGGGSCLTVGGGKVRRDRKGGTPASRSGRRERKVVEVRVRVKMTDSESEDDGGTISFVCTYSGA
jgi:hypothetical protein